MVAIGHLDTLLLGVQKEKGCRRRNILDDHMINFALEFLKLSLVVSFSKSLHQIS
jgi:hypothetical protein